MKILYAIQGTGNGHLARALEVVPSLMRHGEVDLLVSGTHCEIQLPWPVRYKLNGLGFIFGKKGGIDYKATFANFKLATFIAEMRSVPVENYDLVVNDFEPITAWSSLFKRVPCIGISHQRAVMGLNAPRPISADILGPAILRLYAPTTKGYGFHFGAYDKQTFTPVIRKDVRNATATNLGHYTVYLPAYDDLTIVDFLSAFPNERFEVFSKHNTKPFSYKNVVVNKVDKDAFAKSMISAKGVFCNAGFETPAETLYLKKKLCVIPMLGQYEQQCNAYALKRMGVPVLRSLRHRRALADFEQWLAADQCIDVAYHNHTDLIIDLLIARHSPQAPIPQLAFPSGYRF
jgi:uncharacterized protein (TIGR00661 family)